MSFKVLVINGNTNETVSTVLYKNMSRIWNLTRELKEIYADENKSKEFFKDSSMPKDIAEWENGDFHLEIYEGINHRFTFGMKESNNGSIRLVTLFNNTKKEKKTAESAAFFKGSASCFNDLSSSKRNGAIEVFKRMTEFGTLDKFMESR